MNILFTIIVPVYNVEKYINQCLDSILNQTYNTIEIILVNDGSTDSSGLICDEYVNLDSRIKVIHQKNGGLSMARNTGLANANGEYVWFIDSDDWIVDNALQILADQIMQNESVEMISFSMIDFYENYNSYSSPMFLNAVAASDGNNFIASNKLFYAPACSYLYSFNFLKIYNFTFEPNMIHEDDYFNLNCMAQVKQICKIPYGLYYYRRRSNSIITSKASIKKIDSLIKLILLCQTLKKSTLDMVFLENQIFGYTKTALLSIKKIDLDFADKLQLLKKIKFINPSCNNFINDFFYIKFEKYLYNKNPTALYTYLNYFKPLQYCLQFLHYHLLRKFEL